MRFATTRMTTRMTMNSTMRFGRRTSTRRDGARGRVGTIPEPSDGRFESPDPRSARRLPAPSRLADARAFSSPPSPRVDPRHVDERFDSDAGVFQLRARARSVCGSRGRLPPGRLRLPRNVRLGFSVASRVSTRARLDPDVLRLRLCPRRARALASSAFARASPPPPSPPPRRWPLHLRRLRRLRRLRVRLLR